jgi:hypothetical protein
MVENCCARCWRVRAVAAELGRRDCGGGRAVVLNLCSEVCDAGSPLFTWTLGEVDFGLHPRYA